MILNKNKWKMAIVGTLVIYFLAIFCFSFDKELSTTAMAQKPDFSAQGFYTEKCIACHDNKGKPKKTGVPDLSLPEYQKSRTDEQIGTAIMNGKVPKMPAYKSKLDEEKLKILVSYIRAFGRN